MTPKIFMVDYSDTEAFDNYTHFRNRFRVCRVKTNIHSVLKAFSKDSYSKVTRAGQVGRFELQEVGTLGNR